VLNISIGLEFVVRILCSKQHSNPPQWPDLFSHAFTWGCCQCFPKQTL